MSPLKLNQILEVQIDRLSVGGRGVARHDGAVIFVERGAPQERVRVRITLVKKNYAEAELVEVVEASQFRIVPPCPYWQNCGGCSWQHILYSEQLKQKKRLVQDSLQKLSGFKDFHVESCLPSPKEFRYRNRVQVHIQNGELGFFKKNTHELVVIDDCLITDERITKRFSDVRRHSSAKSERIELQVNAQKLRGEADQGFSQVNSEQNQNLQNLVCDLAKKLLGEQKFTNIFDLYAGNANLSLPLARTFSESLVVGVELSSKNVADARQLIQTENLQARVQFHQAKVEDFLSQKSIELASSLIVLDPPRTGCESQTMQTLSEKKPLALIYVSCHPATLARDLKYLTQNYKLILIQPLDMFPQTDHVECVVGLSRLDLSDFATSEII